MRVMLNHLLNRPWLELPSLFFVLAIIWIGLAEGLAAVIFSEADPVRVLLVLRSTEIIGLLVLIWRFHLGAVIALKQPDRAAIKVFISLALCSGAGFAVLLLIAWLLDMPLLSGLGAPDWIHGLSGVLAMLVLAPLAEELFFRGVVYRLFRQSFGVLFAIVLSAVCFAMMHGALLSPQLVGGLIFAVAYEWGRNLWVPIALHAGANAAVLLIGVI